MMPERLAPTVRALARIVAGRDHTSASAGEAVATPSPQPTTKES
jgi:hypothetical protein